MICAPRSVAKDTPDDFDYLIMQWPWRAIWTCPQFPKMSWSKVAPEEKRRIQSHFPSRCDPRGFNALDADLLDAMKVIEKFKKLSQETQEKRDALRAAEQGKSLSERTNESGLRNLASVRNDQTPWVEHIVCTLDYRSGKEALVKAFEAWLKENRAEVLRDYYIPPIVKGSEHSPIRFHEMLKSLTAARLYVTLGCKNAKEWTRKNRRQRADALRLRPFFREKPGKQLNTKPLYRDRREWEYAVAHAKSLLTADFDAC